MKRYKCLFLLLSLFVVNVTAKEVKTLSVQEMHEDIDFYYSTIKAMHPNLYARYSESEFDSLYQEIKSQCNSPLSITEFGYILDNFNGFTDGHTQIIIENDFPDQIFPWVHCKNGKVYLKNDILISIEGIDAMDLQRRISPTISWEFHPKKRSSEFNIKLSESLVNYHKLRAPFNCKIMDEQNGYIKDTLVHAISGEEWFLKSNPSKHPIYHANMLHRAFHEEESIAVLYYNSSKIHQISQKLYIEAIDDFFEEVNLKNISYLFIDVSQNGGGSALAHDYIFNHLKYKSYRSKMTIYATKEGGIRRYSDWETDLLNYQMMDGNKKISKMAIKKAVKKAKKVYMSEKYEHTLKSKGSKQGFEGEVFVIMGSQTYSAGHDFCESIKLRKAGLLVGESSGQYSPYSANSISGTLPNSKLEYRHAVTYIEYSPPVSPENGFLQPDLPYLLTKPLELEDFKEIIRISKHHKTC